MKYQVTKPVASGLRANLTQFGLLVLVNAFVGGIIGVERTTLPLLAQQEFGLASKTAILSFIASFGLVKALTNLVSGYLADITSRKWLLVSGWLAGLPVPWLILWAPSWEWITFANALLGINQGLCWSTAIIMKIDLVGSKRRGLAMGLNEFSGYGAVSLAAFASGYIAGMYGLRIVLFGFGFVFTTVGLLLSSFYIHDTSAYAQAEGYKLLPRKLKDETHPIQSFWTTFQYASWKNRNLFSCNQAGLVNNLNDGISWGLFPLFFASHGVGLNQIAVLVALYPAIWGIGQLVTGAFSDFVGRKWLIVCGMWVQAAGIWLIVLVDTFNFWLVGMTLLGMGTAMVYPTLLAAIGDVVSPSWRASAVGIYRMWRDLGYAVGALLAGAIADWLGINWAIFIVGAITFLSGSLLVITFQDTDI